DRGIVQNVLVDVDVARILAGGVLAQIVERMRGRYRPHCGGKTGRRAGKCQRLWPIRESPHYTSPFSPSLERPVAAPCCWPGLKPERILIPIPWRHQTASWSGLSTSAGSHRRDDLCKEKAPRRMDLARGSTIDWRYWPVLTMVQVRVRSLSSSGEATLSPASFAIVASVG